MTATFRADGLTVARGRTDSPLSLRERKKVAFDCFSRGFTNDQVKSRISVTDETVGNYRREYEGELRQQMLDNPGLLRNVLENTVRGLEELDQARRALWEEYEAATHPLVLQCPYCEEEHSYLRVSSPQTRNQILGNIMKSQELRSRMLGLFGVKQEFLLHVQSVRAIQEALLGFMRENLCSEDKVKLERLLTEELGAHLDQTHSMPVLQITELGPATS